nr:zinc finger protein CO3-like [Lolium perenne]
MCRERSPVLPPPALPSQEQPQEEKEEASAGGMVSQRALKRGEVRRYSAVERRERIERYRIKRNRLNFKKKITYASRKALAENRKRIGGRFAQARDEKSCLPEKIDQTPSSSSGSAVPEWWPAMEVAMAREEEEDSFANLLQLDWEMFSSYLGFNLYSTTDPSIHPST